MYEIINWDYKLDNLVDFQNKLNDARKNLVGKVDVFNIPLKEYSINNLSNLESGRFSCFINKTRFECLLQKKTSNRLYVLFNGALGERGGDKEKSLPNFQRWSWAPIMDANVLNIFDPMYCDYKTLKIGWYYGDKENDYRKYMSEIILKVAHDLNVSNERIVLYGSSAGGTAAFFTAMYIPRCVTVAINPQLFPWKHEWYDQFQTCTGIDMKQNDKFHRNDIYYHIDHAPNNKFILLTNCRSRIDFNFQLIPISKHYRFINRYGMTRCKNLYSWIFDNKGCPAAHRSIDYPAIFVAIDLFIKEFLDKLNEQELNGYIKLINEFWRDHYES